MRVIHREKKISLHASCLLISYNKTWRGSPPTRSLPASYIISPSLGRQLKSGIRLRRGIGGSKGKLVDKKERSRGLTQIRSDTLCFFFLFFFSCQCLIRFLEQREVIQMSGAFKRQTMAFKMFLQTDRWSAKHQSLLLFFFFFCAASPCVFALSRWPRQTEDMYVRDTVKASPTISHD